MAIEEMTDIESLYQRYAPDVRRFVLFLSADPVMADEITSDTFVSAWLARERIRQPTVKSSLFAIARNLYRDTQRRQERHTELDEHMIDQRTSAQTHMEQTAEVRAVLAALQQLPELDRTRVTTSNSDSRAMRSPSGPVRAAWTAHCSSTRTRLSRSAMFRSSSTIRTRTDPPGGNFPVQTCRQNSTVRT
jgi:RNA polymerase sigma factor (sigma-70 family)